MVNLAAKNCFNHFLIAGESEVPHRPTALWSHVSPYSPPGLPALYQNCERA
jgi:hypothetical protein